MISGALLGLCAALIFAWGWARYGHLINIKRFFRVTGIFLLLFMLQVAIYSFHEFSEAGLLPNSETLHAATEKFSPDGLYGKWFSPADGRGVRVMAVRRLADGSSEVGSPHHG